MAERSLGQALERAQVQILALQGRALGQHAAPLLAALELLDERCVDVDVQADVEQLAVGGIRSIVLEHLQALARHAQAGEQGSVVGQGQGLGIAHRGSAHSFTTQILCLANNPVNRESKDSIDFDVFAGVRWNEDEPGNSDG